ncbi:hypothetical protein [Bailinhaonella thermotolerans]|uniref:Phosphoribosyltransferase n=1 Tax=Bailinhaonella thermotolerans TaxID=1070861 RepID=A0A3A4AZ22_9ACTN|nr:hypothetical protein [Bailinhaonella thermotolerans]RJL35627.1 hypothetical protein D5H75_02230 [Bailinhaonella thermotolerans]
MEVAYPTRHIVPISLCVDQQNMLYDVVGQHADPEAAPHGVDWKRFLAATILRFYRTHSPCLASLAGGGFDRVTTIPLTDSSDPVRFGNPMSAVVSLVPPLGCLYRPVLLPDAGARLVEPARPAEHAFAVMPGQRLDGENVLLVEDLYVGGGRVQSAATALRRAGAASVVALVVARLIATRYNDANTRIWAWAQEEPFTFDHCCLCRPA